MIMDINIFNINLPLWNETRNKKEIYLE
jgi:hypothetical protein